MRFTGNFSLTLSIDTQALRFSQELVTSYLNVMFEILSTFVNKASFKTRNYPESYIQKSFHMKSIASCGPVFVCLMAVLKFV